MSSKVQPAHTRAAFCRGWRGNAVGLALALWTLAAPSGAAPQAVAPRSPIPYVDAAPVIEAVQGRLPAELTGKTPADIESSWSGWVSRRNAEIRTRLERGDEDSVVFLWHYGTSFTKFPPVTQRNLERLGGATAAEAIVERRMEDLLTGIASPGADERLRFARQVVERNGVNPLIPAGKAQARLYLLELRRRVLAEYEENKRTQEAAALLDPVASLAAYLTMFRDRGLSSDTSLLPAFAIDQALEGIRADGTLGAGGVRRVAIVGPGLDFANKDDGYDFYPQQTIQPFALMDSLIRLGLATPRDLRVTTFDLSPRVNQHIEGARERARGGAEYTLHFPLQGEEAWNPDLLSYWRRIGGSIGTAVDPLPAPATAGSIQVRAVRLPAARVLSIVPRDLNIVVERLEPLAADERFDLIVATNVLVYYDIFEQELALVNLGKMLKPGGLFLSNTPVPPMAPMTLSDRITTVSYNARQRDYVFRYHREGF